MYKLYIDESGKNSLKNFDTKRPHFSLASVIVHEEARDILKRQADQIKFKYWGKQKDVWFHSAEMRRLDGLFLQFRKKNNPKLPITDLQSDLIDYITTIPIKIGMVCVNKSNYIKANPPLMHAIKQLTPNKKSGWHTMVSSIEKKLLRNNAEIIFIMYLSFLYKKKERGSIIIESSSMAQDSVMFEAYNQLLICGCPSLNLTTTGVREHFTGISFVTKKNHDIETQIADMVAYYLNIEASCIDGMFKLKANSFEQSMITSLKTKTFQFEDSVGGITQNSFLKIH